MWRTIATLAITTFALSAQAADVSKIHVQDGLDFAVPGNSPVLFASIGQYGITLFRGRFEISGTYRYGYLTNDPTRDATYGLLDLYFIPDKNIAARLPYWEQRGQVHEMRFRNDDAFVRAVLAPYVIDSLRQKKVLSVEGRASIVVEDYQASVECDYPTYSVSFVAVDRPQTMLASKKLVDQYGC